MAREGEVRYSVDGPVASVTINRPQRRNALTWTALEALGQRLAEAQQDPEVRVVVLRGEGDQAFCAGIDLSDIARNPEKYARLWEAVKQPGIEPATDVPQP